MTEALYRLGKERCGEGRSFDVDQIKRSKRSVLLSYRGLAVLRDASGWQVSALPPWLFKRWEGRRGAKEAIDHFWHAWRGKLKKERERVMKPKWTTKYFKTATVEDLRRDLAAGADVNMRMLFGRTPLHWAAFGKYKSGVITALINAGADVNAKDTHGVTPLHCAAEDGHYNTVATLLSFGADVNAKESEGTTPLHWAAEYNEDPQVTRELLNAGADVNARDEEGITPLHWAAKQNENVEVITVLLEAGADVKAQNNTGFTPVDWGRRNENEKITEILEKKNELFIRE